MSEQFSVLIASHGYVDPDAAPVRVFDQSDLDAVETLIMMNSDYTVQSKFFEDDNKLMKIVLTRAEPDFYLDVEGPTMTLSFIDDNTRPEDVFPVVAFGRSLGEIIDIYASENELMATYSYDASDNDD